MPIRNPADLIEDLPEKSCLMGLDAGEKTIGMAVSDPGLSIASPLDTVRRGRKASADYDQVVALAKARNVGGFVLGMPVNMDGTAGPRAQATRAFARNLLAKIDLPLVMWDERMSTQAVTRTLLDADMSRAKRAEVVDKMAAAFILQGYLDWLRIGR
ncbi:Holliday junction resolvase RuvX [Halotia wernerae UHCC 0503]|jgi:putative Holliday junction resolvase|nr:Holliday junction resolvase RuvX [Halotia wernerae UHCC 0503]